MLFIGESDTVDVRLCPSIHVWRFTSHDFWVCKGREIRCISRQVGEHCLL